MLPDNKLYKLAEFQELTDGLVHHLIKLSTFAFPVARFLKREAEKAVAGDERFRKEVRQIVPLKVEKRHRHH